MRRPGHGMQDERRFGARAPLGSGDVVSEICWRAGSVALWLVLLGAAAYFASIAFSETKWVRYLLPMVPYLCLFATALGLWLSKAVFKQRTGALRQYSIPGVLVSSALVGAIAFRAIYGVEHTRVQASRWIYANVPAGSHIAMEVNDARMPNPLPDHPSPEKEYQLLEMRTLADFSTPE